MLKVDGLKKCFNISQGMSLTVSRKVLTAVDGVSFDINPGEVFGLVGESGSGKTTTGKLVLGLLTPSAGRVLFEGKDISRLKGGEFKKFRLAVQAVFQDPRSSLDSRMKIRDIIAEPLIANKILPKNQANEKAKEWLSKVNLNTEYLDAYPHELSGGQCQRVALARSMVIDPKLIVLDEPVSGLDVSIRAQIINLLKDIKDKNRISYLYISHDLGTVGYLCDWVAVMYVGRIVEFAQCEELFNHPIHPYSQALLAASLPADPDGFKGETVLRGEVSSSLNIARGCAFSPRCNQAKNMCSTLEPSLKNIGENHWVSCHLVCS